MFRGSVKPGRDAELQILEHFPGVPMFIEKPVATGTEEEIADAFIVAKVIKEKRVVCSVGYVYFSRANVVPLSDVLHAGTCCVT